ncbi:hypothetical protein F4818DRAFT_438901 [Hypoxylon cercidicola]|nr:hypothetical protein F4818DRAFT_438901 [Hypoxylon cercidicola]
MQIQSEQYGDLEPSNFYGDALANVDFDAPEFTGDMSAASRTQSFEETVPGLKYEAPDSPQPMYTAPRECIDPRLLDGADNTTGTTTQPQTASQPQQQQNHGPNHYPANNGSHPANPYHVTPSFPDPAATGYVGIPTPYPQPPWYPQQYPQQYPQPQFQPYAQPYPLPQYPSPQHPPYPPPYPSPYAPPYPSPYPPQYPPEYPPPQIYPMPQSQQRPPNVRRLSAQSSVVSGLEKSRKLKDPEARIPEPIIIPQSPLPRPTHYNGQPLKSGRIPRVTRKHRDRPEPREWYGDPPTRPPAWGPPDKDGRPLFRYTEYGELERGRTYSATEMRQYIYGPKKSDRFKAPDLLQGVPVISNRCRQGLTLWIGWVPAQSNDRYPYDALSQKCRFRECPEPKNTIRSGFPRVVFDERHNVDGDVVNVFHNAGYAHLFCLERHFDLIGTMQVVNVRPDHREFKREENLCKLSRQFPDIQDDIEDWYQEQYPKYKHSQELEKSRKWNYEDTLGYLLVKHAIDHLPDIRARVRESRAGADISKHMGNLEVQVHLNECKKYGLLDENGDPVPHAEEILKSRGRKNRPVLRSESRDTPSTPGHPFCGSAYTGSPSPALHGLPEPNPTSPGPYDPYYTSAPSPAAYYGTPLSATTMSPAPSQTQWPSSPVKSATTHHSQQPMPPPLVGNPAEKRTADQMLARDDQAADEEIPAQKPRVEQPAGTDTVNENAPMWDANYGVQVDGGPEVLPVDGYDSFNSLDPLDLNLDFETELDLDAAFDIIDNEVLDNKVPHNEVPDKSPSRGKQSSVGTIDGLEVEGDLFGDTEETPAAEKPVSRDASPDAERTLGSREAEEDNRSGELRVTQ